MVLAAAAGAYLYWRLPLPDARVPARARWSAAAAGSVGLAVATVAGTAYTALVADARGAVYGALTGLVAVLVIGNVAIRLALRALAWQLTRFLPPLPEEGHPLARHVPADLWVVVPAHNEARGLPDTLAALARQRDTDFTVLVVDNASTDGTAEVAREAGARLGLRLHVVAEPSKGPWVAMATGVAYARDHGATHVLRTDADALPRPGWVGAGRRAFAAGAQFVCGRVVPRRDERPTLVERVVYPAAVRLAGFAGRVAEPVSRGCALPHEVPPDAGTQPGIHRRAVGPPAGAGAGRPAHRDRGRGPPQRRASPHGCRAPGRGDDGRGVAAAAAGVGAAPAAAVALGPALDSGAGADVRHPLSSPSPVRLRRAAVRDLAVYASHPFAFAALAATSRLPQLRLGTTVIVHDREQYAEALTGIPLDRLAAGTTGGQLAAALGVEKGLMFTDADSRAARRTSAAHLSSRQVAALAPAWHPLLQQAAASLADGAGLDVAALARRLGGVTATAVLGISADPDLLADLVLAAAAHATRTELRPAWANQLLRQEAVPPQARELAAMMRPTGPGWLADAAQAGASAAEVAALGVTIALATVATTAAALPRAVAWCADAGLWDALPEHAGPLTAELLRVTAPSGRPAQGHRRRTPSSADARSGPGRDWCWWPAPQPGRAARSQTPPARRRLPRPSWSSAPAPTPAPGRAWPAPRWPRCSRSWPRTGRGSSPRGRPTARRCRPGSGSW